MGGYYVKYELLEIINDKMEKLLEKTDSAVADTKSLIDRLANSDGIEGNVGKNIQTYLPTIHGNILNMIAAAMYGISALWMKYLNGYYENIDAYSLTQILDKALSLTQQDLNTKKGQAEYIGKNIVDVLFDISDISSAANYNISDDFQAIVDSYEVGKQYIADLDAKIMDYEDQKSIEGFGDIVDQFLAPAQKLVLAHKGQMNMYHGGGKSDAYLYEMNSEVSEVLNDENVKKRNELIDDICNELPELYEKSELRKAQIEKDKQEKLLREQEERRKQTEWVKPVVTVVTVAVDIAVIVGTAGAATPVVAAWTIGSGAAMGAVSYGIDAAVDSYIQDGTIDGNKVGMEALRGLYTEGIVSAVTFGVGQTFKDINKLPKVAKILNSTNKVDSAITRYGLSIIKGSISKGGSGAVRRGLDGFSQSLMEGNSVGDSVMSGVKRASDTKELTKDMALGVAGSLAGTAYEDWVGGGNITVKQKETGKRVVILPKYIRVYDGLIEMTSGVVKDMATTGLDYWVFDESESKSIQAYLRKVYNDGKFIENIFINSTKGATKPKLETGDYEQKKLNDLKEKFDNAKSVEEAVERRTEWLQLEDALEMDVSEIDTGAPRSGSMADKREEYEERSSFYRDAYELYGDPFYQQKAEVFDQKAKEINLQERYRYDIDIPDEFNEE